MRFAAFFLCGVFLLGANLAFAQAPLETSLCAVSKDPKAFDGKNIRVKGTFHVSFESFTVFAKGCEAKSAVWVAFGGDVPGIVTSLANDNVRRPGVDVTVDGAPYGIKKDDNFRRLYALLAARHGEEAMYRVTATVTGVFLSGDEQKGGDGKARFGGYGHLGCCSLLVIQEVGGASSVPSATMEAHGVVLDPKGKPLAGFKVFDDVLGGLPPQRQESVTDEHGQFRFTNSGQLLRFEDPQYRPVALPIEPGGAAVSVRLQEARRSDWTIPPCSERNGNSKLIGFAVRYEISPGMDYQRNDEKGEIPSSYFVFPSGGEPLNPELAIFREGAVIPDDAYLGARWSEQRWIRDQDGKIVGRDSRGRSKNGERWRTAIFFENDSAVYRIKTGARTAVIDKIVDSACIAAR
jgi:hypothetical protein